MEKIIEAFQELQLLNEDVFNITTDGVEELKTFIDTPEDELDVIIDPKADTEDELQDSYVGKVILDCVICRSKIYKDPEEVVIGENGIANVGDICPYCQSSDGYTVIGQVEKYDPNAEITIDDEGVYRDAKESLAEDLSTETSMNKEEKRFNDGKFTREELKKLRSEIVLDSLFISDYENSFNLNPEKVYEFFKGYSDYLNEVREDPQDEDASNNYDNIDTLERWYFMVENPLGESFEDEHKESKKAKKVKPLKESKKSKKQLNEELKLIADINDYRPWSGAKYTWYRIVDADKVDELESYLEAIYPDGITMTQLNDILWFDGEQVLLDLGIITEEEYNELTESKKLKESIIINRNKKDSAEKRANLETIRRMIKDREKGSLADRIQAAELEYSLKEARAKGKRNLVLESVELDEQEVLKELEPFIKGRINGSFDVMSEEVKDFVVSELKKRGFEVEVSGKDLGPKNRFHIEFYKKLLKESTTIQIKGDADIEVESEDNVKVDVEGEVKEMGDEMIAPLDKETEEKFKVEEPEEVEVDFDEFDEESFDNLQERYFKENFSNVKSYKTVDAFIDGNKIILEGLIEFKSGNIKKTTFIYEGKSISKDNKLKFLGENKQFTNRKKAFTLTGNVNKNKLMVESISYDHKVMDPVTKEMKRLSGKLK